MSDVVLDTEFLQAISKILEARRFVSKRDRISVSRWVARLRSACLLLRESAQRNRYAELLLLQIKTLGHLEDPFTKFPPDGNLPQLESYRIDRLRQMAKALHRKEAAFVVGEYSFSRSLAGDSQSTLPDTSPRSPYLEYLSTHTIPVSQSPYSSVQRCCLSKDVAGRQSAVSIVPDCSASFPGTTGSQNRSSSNRACFRPSESQPEDEESHRLKTRMSSLLRREINKDKAALIQHRSSFSEPFQVQARASHNSDLDNLISEIDMFNQYSPRAGSCTHQCQQPDAEYENIIVQDPLRPADMKYLKSPHSRIIPIEPQQHTTYSLDLSNDSLANVSITRCPADQLEESFASASFSDTQLIHGDGDVARASYGSGTPTTRDAAAPCLEGGPAAGLATAVDDLSFSFVINEEQCSCQVIVDGTAERAGVVDSSVKVSPPNILRSTVSLASPARQPDIIVERIATVSSSSDANSDRYINVLIATAKREIERINASRRRYPSVPSVEELDNSVHEIEASTVQPAKPRKVTFTDECASDGTGDSFDTASERNAPTHAVVARDLVGVVRTISPKLVTPSAKCSRDTWRSARTGSSISSMRGSAGLAPATSLVETSLAVHHMNEKLRDVIRMNECVHNTLKSLLGK